MSESLGSQCMEDICLPDCGGGHSYFYVMIMTKVMMWMVHVRAHE